jgi:PAS domain S-box-containing protein
MCLQVFAPKLTVARLPGRLVKTPTFGLGDLRTAPIMSTSAAHNTPGQSEIRRRFVLLLILIGLPIAALIGALTWRSYNQAYDAFVRQIHQDMQVRRTGLEQLAADAHVHVEMLKSFVENRIAEHAQRVGSVGRIDWPGQSQDPGPDAGQVISPPGAMGAADQQELEAIYPMFPLLRAGHHARNYLRWSYFFPASRKYVTIYPWAPAEEILGPTNPQAAFDSYFGYDIYKMATPDQNAKREPYWTPIYFDAGGSGLMVSHGSPVYVGDRFAGMVGTDVLLSHIGTFLGEFPAFEGDVVLIDQDGAVVAVPGRAPDDGKAPIKAETIIGNISDFPRDGHFTEHDGHLLGAVRVTGTPWQLVMRTKASAARDAALASITPLALLLSAMLAMIGALTLAFRHQFVAPAVALLNFASRTADSKAAAPDLPKPFQPLLASLHQSKAKNAELMQQMRTMIDSMPLRVGYVDHQGIYRDINQRLLEFLGLKREDVIGKSLEEILGPSVAEQYRDILPRVMKGETIRWEGWAEFPRLGRHYLQRLIMPFAPEGGPPGTLTFTYDSTESELATQALAEKEALNRAVVDGARDAIVVMDDLGITLQWNPAAEQIFGYSAAEAIGSKVGDLIVPATMRDRHQKGMERYLATGKAKVLGKRMEMEGLHKDGSHIPVELTITESLIEGRRLFTSHLRDLTETRHVARAMEESRERLNQSEKLAALGQLLAGVAHELNNPLAIVLGRAAMLQEKLKGTPHENPLQKMREAADRCARIVKTFLAMARQTGPRMRSVQINLLVDGALEMTSYGLRKFNIALLQDLDPHLPEIEADEDQLIQVLINLIINAQHVLADHPGDRKITVRTRHDKPSRRVLLDVADNGPGVPKDLAVRIFEPFYTTKAVGEGTGLGLSMCKGMVESQGGTIALHETPGGGATFRVSLPTGVAQQEVTPGNTSAETRPAGRGRILVVDDEPEIAAILADYLSAIGFETDIATDGATALDKIGRLSFDAIFCDVSMPGMDGVTMYLKLKEQNPLLARKLVFISGDVLHRDWDRIKASVDRPVIEKPFDPELVRKTALEITGATP